MAFARARAARTLQSSLRRSIPRISAPGRTQLVQRRWASGGDHGHAEAGSDLPWALAGAVITVPSCWYLWPDSSHADSGHHSGHDEEHGEETGEEKGEQEAEEEPKDEEAKVEESGPVEEAKPDTEKEQQKEEKQDEEKVEADDRKGSGHKQTGEVKKDDDSKPTKEEANDSEGAEVKKVQKDRTIRKPIPSSGQPLGKSPQEGENEDEAKGSGTSMGSKQAGISNTQAKHSIPIGDSPDKSKKPEGGPETAKSSGTVAVKRHD